MIIDAKGLHYKDLNCMIRSAVEAGDNYIELLNVNGQRYIGDGLGCQVTIVINGVPGNDLGAFMDGPTIRVKANAQDGVGNTMNSGKIVIWGDAGDVLGLGMRGGKLFVRGDAGYRAGIHMKGYQAQVPVIIVGGCAGDFCGEYMAGGVMVLLGLQGNGRPLAGHHLGTGMHGGLIYLRGGIEPWKLGKGVAATGADDADMAALSVHLDEYCREFGLDVEAVGRARFLKLSPQSHRPYGSLYTY